MRDWSRFVVAVLLCAAIFAPGVAWSADVIDVKNPDEFFESMLDELQLESDRRAFPKTSPATTNIEANDPIRDSA